MTLHCQIRSKSFFSRDSGVEHKLLSNLEFIARAGETVAILGPSGCGKTTLLRILLGLDKDFQGSIDRPYGTASAVFQEPRLFPWLTVERNIRLGASEKNVDSTHVNQLLTAAGLPTADRLYPNELSLGMARRVAICRALIGNPSLLIMDEPLVSLDAESATNILSLLAKHIHTETITIMTTHSLSDAAHIADRVIVLSADHNKTLRELIISTPKDRRDRAMIEATIEKLNSLITAEAVSDVQDMV